MHAGFHHRYNLQDRYRRHSHWRTIHPGLYGDCVVWHPVWHHLRPPESDRPGLLGPIFRVMLMWQSVAVTTLGLLRNQSEFKYAVSGVTFNGGQFFWEFILFFFLGGILFVFFGRGCSLSGFF